MALSGRKAVTSAGTRVILATAEMINCSLAVKAYTTNTSLIYVGDLNVGAATGFSLAAGDVIVFDHVGNIASIWIDSAVNGEGVCWLKLSV